MFPNRKNLVVYIDPIIVDVLLQLQEELMISFIENGSDLVDKSDIEYKSHCTVAYRDLSPEMFSKA